MGNKTRRVYENGKVRLYIFLFLGRCCVLCSRSMLPGHALTRGSSGTLNSFLGHFADPTLRLEGLDVGKYAVVAAPQVFINLEAQLMLKD